MIIRLTDNVQHSVYTYTYTSNTFSACIDTVPIAHRLTAQCLMNNYMGFVLKNMYFPVFKKPSTYLYRHSKHHKINNLTKIINKPESICSFFLYEIYANGFILSIILQNLAYPVRFSFTTSIMHKERKRYLIAVLLTTS